MTDDTESGPFGRAAQIYRAAGWLGTLPLGSRPGLKGPPPGGFTGHDGRYPDGGDIGVWLSGPEAGRNLGLRMPEGVIGLDIDAGYSKVENGKTVEKRGEVTLAELEAKWGPLPATWVSSARPAPSGIRFYRVPTHLGPRSWYNEQGSWSWECPCGERSTANLPIHVAQDAVAGHAAHARPVNWPGEAGKFIEIIQPGHRYAVVWPSTNPDADGALYEWRAPNGRDAHTPPTIDAMAPLPDAWVRGLALDYDRAEKADVGTPAMSRWWEQLRDGAPCPLITSVTAKAVAELRAADGSRHEAARDALRAIVAAAGSGHRGGASATAQLAAAFEEAVGESRMRSGEWQRLLRGAVQLSMAEHPGGPRQACDHDPATGLVLPEGFTQPVAQQVSATGMTLPLPVLDVPVPTAGGLTLPADFWEARESLKRIRQAAHSKVRSADVVLYGLLCRLAALTPHSLRADTGIGTPASLNLFAAIVGPSGAGKSSGLSVARKLIKIDKDIEEFPLGSGEGVAEAFMGETDEPTGEMDKHGAEKTKRVRKQVRHNALFHSDEGASLNKLIERAGSTVGETLRSAWSGEAIGQKNGRVETTRTVPAESYSLGLSIGYQPSTVLPLLNDHETGTPQRFLYVWAVDPTIPGRDQRVPWPGEMPNPFPATVPTSLPPPGAILAGFTAPPVVTPVSHSLTFGEAIMDELYDLEHAKASGTLPQDHPLRDPFRSQHTMLKIKVSGLLALLESRRHVTAEDWSLAQVVLDTSDRVREWLQILARDAAGKVRAASLAAEAEAEHYRAHARASVTAQLDLTSERRVAVRVAELLHGDGAPATLAAVRRRIAYRDRPMLEAAVEIATRAGWLIVADDGRLAPSVHRPGAAAMST
jgi:hypothetical protein